MTTNRRRRLAEHAMAFMDGYNAAFDTPHSPNPYEPGAEHDTWNAGYRAGEEEIEGKRNPEG